MSRRFPTLPFVCTRPHRAGAGLTLLELLIGLAVLMVLLAGALPNFSEALERRRLMVLSADSLALLQQARLEAQWRAEAVRVAVRPASGGATCLLLHTGPSQACSCPLPDGAVGTSDACVGGAERVRVVLVPAGRGLNLSLNVPSMRFDPTLGTTTPAGRLVVQGRRAAIHHVVNAMGRVRSCVPSPGALPTGAGPALPAC